jgi:hypothetical protein
MATLASIGINITGDSKELSTALASASAKMESFAQRAGELGNTLSTRLTLPIVGAGALMLKAFTEEEDALARLTAGLRANGGQANVTADEIRNLASQLQRVTTFGDETTISAAALLTTFHQIRNEVGAGNDVFNRTIIASQDLAAAMGIDLQSATMQLAKALENPTIGLGALTRTGTTFTEQQKQMIQTLVESGRQLEAQTMILDVVESQYKGTAQAIAQTTSGQIKNAFNELGDEMEQFGRIIAGAVIKLLGHIRSLVRAFAEMDEQRKRMVVGIAAIAAAIGPALLALKGLVAVFAALATPIALKVAALASLAAVLKYVHDNAQAFGDRFTYAFMSARNAVIEMVATSLDGLGKLLSYMNPASGASFMAMAIGLRAAKEELADMPMTEFGSFADSVKSGLADIGRLMSGLFDFTMPSPAPLAQIEQKVDTLAGIRVPTLGRALVANINRPLAQAPAMVDQMSASIIFAQAMAENFTNSFGAGMANIVVQGERLTDVLKNIGKLLLSSAIQTGIRLLLLGTAGFGVAGGTRGIIGSLFGGASAAPVAGSALTLDGAFTLQGTDLVLAINRSERTFR